MARVWLRVWSKARIVGVEKSALQLRAKGLMMVRVRRFRFRAWAPDKGQVQGLGPGCDPDQGQDRGLEMVELVLDGIAIGLRAR